MQNPDLYQGVRFTCEASIVAIDNNKSWNYLSCHECNKESFHLQGLHICEDHGEQTPPPYMYNFKATAADGKETAEFTFFNTAGYKITGHNCVDFVSKFERTPTRRLPPEITNIIGKRHIFQIQFANNSQKGTGRFIVNDILDLPTMAQSASTSVFADIATPTFESFTAESITGSTTMTQDPENQSSPTPST